jgi:hypothetical protein
MTNGTSSTLLCAARETKCPEREQTDMPFTDNKGVHIHYRVEGSGPPLVLQHGYGNALESWYELGYVDALKK